MKRLFSQPSQVLAATVACLLSFSGHTAVQNQHIPEVDLSHIQGSRYQFERSTQFERNIAPLSTAFYDTEPDKRADGLRVGKSTNRRELIALAKDISEGKHGKFDSILIAQKGELVFESYFNKGRVNLPHPQASATKVYTALAVGRAIQLGYLSMDDLHKPVVDFLTDIDPKTLPANAKSITLDHTLSMRSGFRFTDAQENSIFDQPARIKGQKLASFYFERSQPVLKKNQRYHYQPSDPQLTMLVLDAVVPGSAKAFIKRELLDKLGIHNYLWNDIPTGIPGGPSGTSMTSRDMIKWGQLFEQQGRWHGEQLISPAYLQRATSSIATPYDDDFDYSNFRYGYFFWGTTLSVKNTHYDLKLAWGGGNQMVIAIEALDLVIAITARIRDDVEQTFDLIEQRILPAFSQA